MSGKRKALCAVLTLLTAALLLWIFSNSLKNSQESASQSGAVREWIQTILDALFSGSVVISSHAVRKLAHFSEYALLGAMLLFTWRAYTAERKRLLFPALVAALAPFLDEGLQFFSEGRARCSPTWARFARLCRGISVCVGRSRARLGLRKHKQR